MVRVVYSSSQRHLLIVNRTFLFYMVYIAVYNYCTELRVTKHPGISSFVLELDVLFP